MAHLFPVEAITDDLLMSVVFGDLLTGVGMAIVFNNRSSTGGTDILAKVLNKYTALEIGKSLLVIDFFIGASAGFLLQSVDLRNQLGLESRRKEKFFHPDKDKPLT